MDKAQLAKLLNKNDERPNDWWREAFRLYKIENPESQLHAGCKSCRLKVYKWLKS